MADSKERVLIIFPNEWLAYSPSVINLCQCFTAYNFECDIVTFGSEKFGVATIEASVVYININKVPSKVRNKYFKVVRLFCEMFRFKKKSYSMIIGVDLLGYIVAKKFFKQVIYYSLELPPKSELKILRKVPIRDMIIQTEERSSYFSLREDSNVYYIQNSPIFKNTEILKQRNKKQLIHFGSIIKEFKVYEIIESLYFLDETYSLELHGIIQKELKCEIIEKYDDLIKSQRLKISCDYLSQDEVIDYLCNFGIGMCLYDIEDTFKGNYDFITCPSGKLFNYYMSGIPVVGNDMVGLKSIKEFNTGKCLKIVTPQFIAEAVISITESYEEMQRNCIEAAKYYDYQAAFKKFLESYLKHDEKGALHG